MIDYRALYELVAPAVGAGPTDFLEEIADTIADARARPQPARALGPRRVAEAARRARRPVGLRRSRAGARRRCVTSRTSRSARTLATATRISRARARRSPRSRARRVVGESSIEETAPLGPIAQPDYLNQMLAVETTLAPARAARAAATDRDGGGATRDVRWGPRTLDLDIVRFDEQTLNTPIARRAASRAAESRLLAARARRAAGSGAMNPRTATPAVTLVLPSWAKVTPKRRVHIERVCALLSDVGGRAGRVAGRAAAWLRAGTLHDALRDAPDAELRELTGDMTRDAETLHGPAAAAMLESMGETDRSVLLRDSLSHGRLRRVGSRRARAVHGRLPRARAHVYAARSRFSRRRTRRTTSTACFARSCARASSMRCAKATRSFPETVALWNAVR